MARAATTYGATARWFHWLVAALLAVQLAIGLLMPDIRRGMTPGAAMALHVSIGMTLLALVGLRLLWRLGHPVAHEAGLPAWQRRSAAVVHWLLYAVLVAAMLTGWFFLSAHGWAIDLYGLVPLPRLTAEGSALGHAIGELHAAMIWVLAGLVGLHAAAAFVHLFVYKDRVMQRMLRG